MKIPNYKSKLIYVLIAGTTCIQGGCQKTGSVPSTFGVASFTVVDAIPNTYQIIPVINTSGPIAYFNNAQSIYYGSFGEYSPPAGSDTVYVVHDDDTLDVGPKAAGQMFYGILSFSKRNSYSLFLCGSDTTSPDYLFTNDTLPYHEDNDSTVGIRFVNLSTGSSPISINLQGNPNGSEVRGLSYKGITGFKDYSSSSLISSSSQGYTFVFRDAVSGDSLTSVQLTGRNGLAGLTDPNGTGQLTFKNITIALIGQPGINAVVPQGAMVIDDF
jgi:hypothetical protein